MNQADPVPTQGTKESAADKPADKRAIARIWIYIVPFVFVLYFFNTMDRSNLGFAALRMRENIQMTPVDFGNVVSAFFISYLLFQIPSNMIISRLGARRWLGVIVIGWSLATLLMFVVTTVSEIMWARIALGVFEAGFFPGVIYYLSLWFPGSERAKVTAWFMMAAAASAMIAGPVSGWIVQNFNFLGHAGWRWLFVIEGVPSIFLGILAFFVLSDSPRSARWLKHDESEWLTRVLEAERAQAAALGKSRFRDVITNPVLWKLGVIYMCVQGAAQTGPLWFPSILKAYNFGVSDTTIGFIMALPFVCALVAMPLWGYSSDRAGERKWHTVIAMGVAALSFLMLGMLPGLALKLLALAVYGIGAYSYYGTYWAMPALMLSPGSLAVSVAFINSCSSLGGYIASKILGYVEQFYGVTGVLIGMAVMSLVSVGVLLTMRVPRERYRAARA